MIKVGFTGTQAGMTIAQRLSVSKLLSTIGGAEFHHGDCVGADAQAAVFARVDDYKIIGHPPTNDSKRAFFDSDEERFPASYLTRNHNIVDQTKCLIAAPATDVEQQRSGTWATIRYARKQGKKIIIVAPNGALRFEK